MKPLRSTLVLSALLGMTLAFSPKATPTPAPRRVALRAPDGLLQEPDVARIAEWARHRGVEVQTAPESSPVPKGFDAVHLSTLPGSDRVRELAAAFPVTLDADGFTFDGRSYRGPEDAVFLADPSRVAPSLVLGNSARAVIELAARRVLRREGPGSDYEVVSGPLSKEGRFARSGGALNIDRAADRDQIADRETFLKDLGRETRGGIEWSFREPERAAAAAWEKAASRFAGKKVFSVRLFPDAVTKGLYTGSSRPADLSVDAGRVRVDVDASTPREPDLVSPVLAAAALAAAEPAMLERRTLMLAAGARRFGKWWGRDVRGFAAFTRAAKVEPSIDDILHSSEDVSPVLAVGTAASWLDAGARLDGQHALDRLFKDSEGALREKLSRWREAAARQTVVPPPHRNLPSGFLSGVSYAMTNSIEEGYVAPRSLGTLKRLQDLSVNSISVMPFAFSRDAKSDRIAFVHRSPQGETDEGTLRAVTDARSLGMSAMVKPQLWLGGGAFVGDIAMGDERSWRSWFDSYRSFIVHHAVVAEAAGAALFCVGTELKSTEERKNDWREVVAAVRLATGAPLLYAANWAVNAPRVLFWDSLDAIGVDFYDPLAKTEKVSDAMLDEGVRQAVRPLAELSRKLEKPVLFTEVGYPSVRGAWIEPHLEGARRPADDKDAGRAVAAVYRALAKEDWWKGVYWWKVFSDGRPAAPGERGFNFLGTPTEKAIGDGFKQRGIGHP
ncbi:MAG: hypothetical protein ABI968_03020 [Acidobacteriota bacterium]